MDELRDALETHADGFGGKVFILGDANFDENFQKRVEIKTKYDPRNWFRFNQNIQTEI